MYFVVVDVVVCAMMVVQLSLTDAGVDSNPWQKTVFDGYSTVDVVVVGLRPTYHHGAHEHTDWPPGVVVARAPHHWYPVGYCVNCDGYAIVVTKVLHVDAPGTGDVIVFVLITVPSEFVMGMVWLAGSSR